MDGGITVDNVSLVKEAGANVIVAGSAVFRGDIREKMCARCWNGDAFLKADGNGLAGGSLYGFAEISGIDKTFRVC